jgi:mono/diheme cytochrome c family protein
LISCSQASGNRTTLEYFPNMMDSPAVKAQREPMRTPVEGTLPRNFEPYHYKVDEGDLAGAELKNPLPMTKATLELGKKTYNTYCIVCHGPQGKGNGFIVPKFPMPPTLHSDKVRNWSDGRIYHVITMGQNLMPSYASQIPPTKRWATISYLRAIQRAVHPTEDDIQVYKDMLKGKK